MSPIRRPHPVRPPRSSRALRPHPLSLALAFALAAPAGLSQAQVLPAGASVARGQASIVTQGNQMTITNSANAVLNWQSFSIGAGQSVRFEQPSASSQVLNRVLGRDPSQIAGNLSSNGSVWLLNPYGVMFGPGARVDVTGLVVSTLNISDADWQARRFSLLDGGLGGSLVNQGEIRTALGGRVLLLGGSGGVRNEGLIEAPGGQVVLAAGASIDLADSRSPQIGVRVTAPAGEAVNLGRVLAPGGAVDLSAAMVNQQGILRADSLSAGPGGEIRLSASGALDLPAGSVTSADGGRGGRVVVQGGTTLVAGSVHADGSSGPGGAVRLLGNEVGLLDGASVSASGRAGGGEVLVGGGLQGKDPEVPNARAVYMAPGATVSADATGHGDGGRIVLWSDRATRAYGTLSARGGPEGGDGGFIETSGGWLDARPAAIRTDAPKGKGGQWLLDPNDILITDISASDSHITAGPNFESTDDSATIDMLTLASALNAGSNVTVTTANAGANTQVGTITMEGSLLVHPPNAVSFTLNAARHIELSGVSIASSNQPIDIVLSAGTAGAGSIQIASSSLSTSGNIKLGGPSIACGSAGCAPFAGAVGTTDAGRGFGVSILGSSLQAQRIDIRGASAVDNQLHGGVRIDSGSDLTAQRIDIAGWTGSPVTNSQYGVLVGGTLRAYDQLTIEGTSRISGPGGVERTAVGVDLTFFGNLVVGPAAVAADLFSATFDAGGGRRALAADPTRWLKVIGHSDPRSSLASYSVRLDSSVSVSDKAGITLTGNGGDLLMTTSFFDASGAGGLQIGGDSRVLVNTLDATLPSAEPVTITNTLGLSMLGEMSGSPSSLRIDSPSGTVSIGNSLGAGISVGSAPIDVRASTVRIGKSGQIGFLTGGRIALNANRIELGSDALLSASGPGTAITAAGLSGNAPTFLVDPDANPLSTPNGRWLVYATDPTDSANFGAGSLVRDFTQYGATAGVSAPIGAGNGMLFSLSPLATIQGRLSGPDTKPYDGTTSTSATVVAGGVSGLLAGDRLASDLAFGAASYASPDAGTSIPIVASLIGGTPAVVDAASRPVYGYRFGGVMPTGTITPRPVTVGGVTVPGKVYDGTRDATVNVATIDGLVAGQSLTVSAGTVAFDTPDAGRAKPVTGDLALADGPGGRASNYVLSNARVAANADILPRPVTLAGASVQDKVYDGNATATIVGGALSGLVGSQTLSLVTGQALFDDAHAGNGKTVTASLQLGDGANGGLAANYTLTNGAALVLRGNILPRPLSLSGLRVNDKTYDGSAQALTEGGTLVGVLPGEALGTRVDARFDDAHAGAGKRVSVQLALVDGAGGRATDYTLVPSTLQATASILPRPVTVGGVTAADKPYDGTTAATLTAGSITGLVAGETLSLASGAVFDNRSVGSGKTVTGTVALADGSGRASDYRLTNGGSFSGTASIVPRGLTVTAATAADKVYDGTTTANVSGFSISGALPGEQVSVSAGSGRFADPGVGAGKAVTATATALTGADAANYALAQPSVQTRASISPATLTYVADRIEAAANYPLPLPTGSVQGFVPGDDLRNATRGELLFTTTAVQGSAQGSYAVRGGGLSAPNYRFVQAPGNDNAYTIVRLSTSQTAEHGSTTPTVPGIVAALQPTPVVSSVSAHRSFDALPAMQSAPGSVAFGAVDIGGSSRQDLARMLAARDIYKKSVFADAIRRIEDDPAVADVPSCQSAEQAAAGNCLITEALKPVLRERLLADLRPSAPPPAPVTPVSPGVPAALPAPAPAPTATPTPTPTPAPAPAAAPAPAPAAAPPVVPVTAPSPAISEPSFRLPAPRPVRTAVLPQIQRKWALLIGTDIYRDTRIPQLDNAVKDVDAVAQVLEQTLGYQTVVVRNGSKAAILRAFNQLAATVGATDSVAIYYAGHGELVEKLGLGFWQPSDADAERPETWISNTDIGKLLGQLGASQVVLVSDSCFSGSLVSDERIRAGGATPDPAALLSRRAAVVMSSGANEPVFDSGRNGHSTFAWSFMRALEAVSSWRPGGNLFEQVRFAVARQVPQRPQYGASRLGGHQPGADYVFEQRQLETPSK